VVFSDPKKKQMYDEGAHIEPIDRIGYGCGMRGHGGAFLSLSLK
jgi:hypothetical protein